MIATSPRASSNHDPNPPAPAGRLGLLALALVAVAGVLVGAGARADGATPSSNLLFGDQAGFAASTGGWVAYGATLQQVASPSDADPGALQVTATSASPSSAVAAWSGAPAPYPGYPAPSWGATPSPNLTAATPGLVYSGWAQVMPVASGTTETVAPALGFWDGSGKPLGYVPGTQSQVTSGVWSATTTAVALAPPGAAYVAVAVELRSSTGQWSVDVDDAVLTSQTDVAAPVVGPLHTNGTQIFDTSGNTVVPRGIDYTGLRDSATPSDLSQATFASLHGWGATLVRISLNEDLWLPESCAYDPNYQAAVAEAVQWTTALGMVALLDLHLSNPDDIGATSSCPGQAPQVMADAPGADAFWTSVAGQYKDDPLVAFDLFNEPHDITADVWRNGGAVNGFSAEGMQELYDDVRGAGAHNLIFVQGLNWANSPPPSADLLTGYNVVYDVHYYTCQSAPPPQCAYGGNPYDPSTGLAPWVTFEAQEQVPVFVGEFGWPSTSDGTYNQNVVAYADAHGWGWNVWEYGGTVGRAFDIVASLPSSGAMEPSPSGMPILADLAAHSPPPGGGPTPPPAGGYWLVASDGGVFSFGVPFLGSMGSTPLRAPVVAMAGSPSGGGYWLVASDGGVFSFGVPFLGSMGSTPLRAPVVAMASSPVTGGYWLVASDGGIFSFGTPFFGSMGGVPLARPVVGMAPTPDGGGYWLVSSDGGIFAFGDAPFLGSMGGVPLSKPVVGMAPTPDGGGYWLVSSDGGIFAFGDAPFFGSMGSVPLAQPIVAVATTPDGHGYWLAAADGGIFAFGDAPFLGSLGDLRLALPVVGAATSF